jgi:predicted P-loop ATPase
MKKILTVLVWSFVALVAVLAGAITFTIGWRRLWARARELTVFRGVIRPRRCSARESTQTLALTSKAV